MPVWIRVLVFANPVSYQLDLLRFVLLDFRQLPMVVDLLVITILPVIAALAAAMAMAKRS